MRFVLLNPNASVEMTARMCAVAREAMGPGHTLEGHHNADGPAAIRSAADNAHAVPGLLALGARHLHRCDAAILGVSMDTALGELRRQATIPVAGVTESAMLLGSQLGAPVGLVTVGPGLAALYRDLVRQYGLGARLAGVIGIEAPGAYGGATDATVADKLRDAVRTLHRVHGARVVVTVAAALCGYVNLRDTDVPLYDGLACAALQALALARLRQASLYPAG